MTYFGQTLKVHKFITADNGIRLISVIYDRDRDVVRYVDTAKACPHNGSQDLILAINTPNFFHKTRPVGFGNYNTNLGFHGTMTNAFTSEKWPVIRICSAKS